MARRRYYYQAFYDDGRPATGWDRTKRTIESLAAMVSGHRTGRGKAVCVYRAPDEAGVAHRREDMTVVSCWRDGAREER